MGQGNDLNILVDEYYDDEIPIFSIFGDMSPVAFLTRGVCHVCQILPLPRTSDTEVLFCLCLSKYVLKCTYLHAFFPRVVRTTLQKRWNTTLKARDMSAAADESLERTAAAFTLGSKASRAGTNSLFDACDQGHLLPRSVALIEIVHLDRADLQGVQHGLVPAGWAPGIALRGRFLHRRRLPLALAQGLALEERAEGLLTACLV